jgi:membrane associated rhomboid family serine protease
MGVHNLIFTVSTYHPEYVWTWILSIFAHSPFSYGHIIVNSIALYFFGPSVERYLGTKKFFYLFIFSGILAALSQVGANLLTTTPGFVLGASGAIMAIMGFLTVLNPNLRVYLYFFLPLPLWVLTIGFAIISVFLISVGGFGAGGVAQLAHIIGLLIGIVYGERFKRNNSSNSATKTSFKPKIGF